MSSDAELPELPNVPFLLQVGAPQQQLHLGWGSNINFGSDPVNASATRALSAAGPLLVATSTMQCERPWAHTPLWHWAASRTRHSVQRSTGVAKTWGFESPCFPVHRTEGSRTSSHACFSWVDKPHCTGLRLYGKRPSCAKFPLLRTVSSLLPHFPFSPLVVSTVLCCSGVQLRPLPWELPLVPLEVLLAETALQLREAGGAVLLSGLMAQHFELSWTQLMPIRPRKEAGEQWALCKKVHGHSPTPLTQQNVIINGTCERLKTFQVEQQGLKFKRHFNRKRHQ